MWYPTRVTVAPSAEPVTAAEVKAQIGIASDDARRDAEITRLIAATRSTVERMCGIRLMTQTIEMRCDAFAELSFLPDGPLQSVDSVVYTSVDGATATLPQEAYEVELDGLSPSVVLAVGKSWPAQPRKIVVTATAGYGDTAADVPPDLRTAILMKIGSVMNLSGRDMLIASEDIDGVRAVTYGGAGVVTRSIDEQFGAMLAPFQRFPLV